VLRRDESGVTGELESDIAAFKRIADVLPVPMWAPGRILARLGRNGARGFLFAEPRAARAVTKLLRWRGERTGGQHPDPAS
jgi:hypothetical protein